MKILVTGGYGFIGSKIVELLCKKHSVTVLDNMETYGIVDKQELRRLVKWRTRKWKKVTTLYILRLMGFRWFKDDEVDSGLIMYSEKIRYQCISVSPELLDLENQDYIAYLDKQESQFK